MKHIVAGEVCLLVVGPKCITQIVGKASWNMHVDTLEFCEHRFNFCLPCDRRDEDIPSVSVLGSPKKTTKRSRSISLRMVAASGACSETLL